jgi:hypothetical protein
MTGLDYSTAGRDRDNPDPITARLFDRRQTS